MRVRPACVADAEAIARVHVRSWQAAYRGQIPDDFLAGLSVDRRRAVWEEILSTAALPRTGALVVEEDEDVVGFAHVSPSRDSDASSSTGELTAIYLMPEVWRRGGGRLLMDSATASLGAAGFRRATLWVLETNTGARRFYEATGWNPDGARKCEDRGAFALDQVRYALDLQGPDDELFPSRLS